MVILNKIYNNRILKLIVPILFLVSLVTNLLSFEANKILQGDSRVVNYAGIIRGATQRLVKQEMMKKPNDELIKTLDYIIINLSSDDGKSKYTILENDEFRLLLSYVSEKWTSLKNEIHKFRKEGDIQKLYHLSEEYFDLTNNLVFSAQRYSEEKMDKVMTIFRPLLFTSISLISIIFIFQLFSLLYLQKHNKSLNQVALYDQLTKLPNRAYFNRIVEQYNNMEQLPKLACVFLDLNNLKITNDTLGHDYGDMLIQTFSAIIKEICQPHGFVCRHGGDEFVALFEDHTKDDVAEYYYKMQQKAEIINNKDLKIKISFACGISFSDEPHIKNFEDLLKEADQRMYLNKEQYKKDMNKSKNV